MTAGAGTHRSQLPAFATLRRRLSLIGWGTAACGALIVSLAIGFLIPLFGSLHELARVALVNVPLSGAYLVLSGVIITRH